MINRRGENKWNVLPTNLTVDDWYSQEQLFVGDRKELLTMTQKDGA
jgi:hypothetical protein